MVSRFLLAVLLVVLLAGAASPAQAVVLSDVPADVPSLADGPHAGPAKYCTVDGALRACTRWYPAGNGTKLLVDVWRSGAWDATSDLPTVVVFHGGGFHSGWRGRSFGEGDAKGLARQGFLALTVDYRLGPCEGDPSGRSCVSAACRQAGVAHPCVDYTQTVDEFDREGSLDDLQGDVASAVHSARTIASRYGGDQQGKVGTLGTSAGGHLALWANYRGEVLGARADAAVSYAGPPVLDPRVFVRYGQNRPVNPVAPIATALQMIGCPRDDDLPAARQLGCDDGRPGLDELECQPQVHPPGTACAARYRRASVTSELDRRDPPARMVQARNDVRTGVRQAWMFWREVKRRGLIRATGFERWIWENGVSCVDGGKPGLSCAIGNNFDTPGRDDCGATHTAFDLCRYDGDVTDGGGQAIDTGGPGPKDDLTLPPGYSGRSESIITACFLLRRLDHARLLARADCPRP